MIRLRHLCLICMICLSSSTLQAQYLTFTADGNLHSQEVLQTSDGGFLLVSLQSCYTPNTTVIEGCTYAFNLIRTDLNGDTLWTKINSFSSVYATNLHLYEEADGGFTFILIDDENNVCDDIVSWLGFRQMTMIRLSATGEELNTFMYPDNCEFILKDVIRLPNGNFMVAGVYDTPISSDGFSEAQVFVMDNTGSFLEQLSFWDESLNKGGLIRNNAGDNLLFYLNFNNDLSVQAYNDQLELQWQTTSQGVDFSALNNAGRVALTPLDNGDIMLRTFEYHVNPDNTHLLRFDSSMQLLWEKAYTLDMPTNVIEDVSENLILASTHTTVDGKDIQINFYTAEGDSLNINRIDGGKDERPTHLIRTATNQFALAGNLNCCNYDTIIGPGEAFLLLEKQLMTNVPNISATAIKVFPNPAFDYVTVAFIDITPPEQSKLELYTIDGRLVHSQDIIAIRNRIDIQALQNGFYYYRILTKGQVYHTGKLIKS